MKKIFLITLSLCISTISYSQTTSIDSFEELEFGNKIDLFTEYVSEKQIMSVFFKPFKAVLKSDTLYGFTLKYATSAEWNNENEPKNFAIKEVKITFSDGSFKTLKSINVKKKSEDFYGHDTETTESYFLIKNINDYEKPVIQIWAKDPIINKGFAILIATEKSAKTPRALLYSYIIPYTIGLIQKDGSCTVTYNGKKNQVFSFPTHLEKLKWILCNEMEGIEDCNCK